MSDNFIVASKVKKHVKETHEMRTSQEALEALSKMVAEALAKGAQNATADKRKTIAARDLE